MTEIYSVINQKGGVGKSTIVQALGQGLQEIYGKKVLFMDLDAQGNLSYALGADPKHTNIKDVLERNCNITDAIQHLTTGDIIASSAYLTLFELERPTILKDLLMKVQSNYDYIVIDTPPALSKITYNALTASTDVLIPALPDVFSLQGIQQLYTTINAVKNNANKTLNVKGIILTKYNDRTVLNQSVAEQLEDVAKQHGTKVFNTKIRDAVAVREAQINAVSIYNYAPKAKVTQDFKQLLKEVIHGN